MLTFSQACTHLARYAERGGCLPSDPRVPPFVIEVMQSMLWQGAYGNMRKFDFRAVKGEFTIPYELEVIEKVKVGGRVGQVWDRWYTFHSSTDLIGCLPANDAVFEEPNYAATAFPLPKCANIGIQGTSDEAPDASIIIKGFDVTGREIVTFHKGEQIVGEYLSIQKGVINFTTAQFSQITGVVKTKTNGYATLYYLDQGVNRKGFLSDYSPLEQIPAYRKYRLTTRCDFDEVEITVLGRIRLKEAYSASDLIPFENIQALKVAGQAANEQANFNVSAAEAGTQFLSGLLDNENSYKKPQVAQPIDVYRLTSGGGIRNIVGRRRW